METGGDSDFRKCEEQQSPQRKMGFRCARMNNKSSVLTGGYPPDNEIVEEITLDDDDDIQVIEDSEDDGSYSTNRSDRNLMTPSFIIRRKKPLAEFWIIARFDLSDPSRASAQCWIKGKVIKILEKKSPSSSPFAVIQFTRKLKCGVECEKVEVQVSLNNVAFWIPTRYALGTRMSNELRRVVVKGDSRNPCKCSTTVVHYHPGIIVESKLISNYGSRYLVYLDCGKWRYVAHEDVRLMCAGDLDSFMEERRKNLFPESDDFLKFTVSYLNEKNECPWRLETKQYKKAGGVLIITRNEKWELARILEVDRELVKVEFVNADEVEWIYRGSPRFKNVFDRFLKSPPQYWKWESEPEDSRLKLLDTQADFNGLSSCLGFLGCVRILPIPERKRYSRNSHEGECDENCVAKYVPSDLFKSCSPLRIPLRFGWKRTVNQCSRPSCIVYISPCGKEISSKTLFTYLRRTKSNLALDWFCFDECVNCLSVFESEERIRFDVKDISNGQENVEIRCINSVDDEAQPEFHYTSKCVVGEDVKMMGEEEALEFCMCCDCTDGSCASSSTCACRRLTVEGAVQAEGRDPDGGSGYINRKLMNRAVLGIFECNNRCACQQNLCTNRAVQNGIQWPLQVFKTKCKGLAVRAVSDIPKGSFICIYAGVLNTELVGDKFAKENGSEYLADLAFISKTESLSSQDKLGYEACATEPTEGSVVNGSVTDPVLNDASPDDQQWFTIDAKHSGNVGRFFNHSCKPNMFLQHVFVNTHDLRFPQLALFTSKHVKAGSELCWFYGYEVGSVPGVNIPCHCEAPDCRKILL